MSGAERAEFKRFCSAGVVTVFGLAICAAEGCKQEVPRGKKLYCSQACWQKEEGRADGKEDEDESGPVD
jgi:hypothetical protein